MKKYILILYFLLTASFAYGQQIPDLDAIDAVASGDLYYCVDVSDNTDRAEGTGKKCTIAQMQTAIDTDTDTTCDGSSCSISNTGTLDGYEASALLDNTDAQDLSLSVNTLSLTGDGTSVDLSGYLDNTDTTYTAGDALTLTGTDFDFDGGATPSGDLGGTWGTPTVTWGNIAEGELADNSIVTADIKDGEVQIGDIGAEAVGPSELDDSADTAATNDIVMIDNGDTAEFKYVNVPDCDTAATSKLLYDSATQAFSCGTDQDSGGSLALDDLSDVVSSDYTSGNILIGRTGYGFYGRAISGDLSLTYTGALTIDNEAVGPAELDDSADSPATNDIVMIDNGDTAEFKYISVPDCDTAGVSQLMYDSGTQAFSCGTDAAGDLLANGTIPLTADWDVGNYDLTMHSLTADGTVDFSGADSLEIPNTAGDVTLANAGEIAVDSTQKQLAVYDGVEIAIPLRHIIFGPLNLADLYDIDTDVPILELDATVFPDGIVITGWEVDSNVADPTTELDANLTYCDDATTGAFPGANPTLIDVIDTTAGNSSEATMGDSDLGSGVIPSGKFIYIDMDADPTDANTFFYLKIEFYIPES